MNQKKRHVLNVYSQEISLFSSDTEEYMKKLASFVDERMHSFASGVSRISFGDLCILTSLSIADDYFKDRENFSRFKEENSKLEEDLAEALSKIMALEAVARERELKIEKLEENLKNLDSSLSVKSENKEALIKKLNVLSYELRKPLEERNFDATLRETFKMVEEAGKEKESPSDENQQRLDFNR